MSKETPILAENSAIEWTDHTFNPWVGCTKISPGCDNCYAEGWAKRSGLVAWNGAPRRTSESAWRQPLKWHSEAPRSGVRKRVFCASLADVFDNQAPDEWRADLWNLILLTPQLDWLLLTKRPQNIAAMLPSGRLGDTWKWPWPHVSLGVTAENQDEADRRIPILLATPAARRFVSVEPTLGPVDLRRVCLVPKVIGSPRAGIHIDTILGRYVESGMPYVGEWHIRNPAPLNALPRRLDWIICGGESGPGARPMHPDWARSLRDQCVSAGVPFFFKQWGEWIPSSHLGAGEKLCRERRYLNVSGRECHGPQCNVVMHRIGKKAAGALLDGREHREMPA